MVYTPSVRLRRGCGNRGPGLEVLLPVLVLISLLAAVERRPLGLVLEEAHRLGVLQNRTHQHWYPPPTGSLLRVTRGEQKKVLSTHVRLIRREPMINARGHDHQVVFLEPDPHPLVALAAHVEVASAVEDVPDLLVLVQVLGEEVLDLGLVLGQRRRRDGHFVAVLVVALGGQRIDGVEVWVVEVADAQRGEVVGGDIAAGVVGGALVALEVRDRY